MGREVEVVVRLIVISSREVHEVPLVRLCPCVNRLLLRLLLLD
jgi:hypothetical protein